MADRGVTTFAFSENPAPLGLPTIHDQDRYWDPVMAAANELEMVASMHVGSSSQVPQIAPDSPFMANLTWGAIRTSGAMLSWIFSGMFQRYPNLKIALSEGEIGWMPYFLERAEQVLDKQRHWVMKGQQFMDHATTDVDLDKLDIRETFRNHVYGCFIEDHHGIASLDEIGEDNIMCETDYPHSDSTWPNCIGTARRVIEDLARGRPVQAAARQRRAAVPLHAGRDRPCSSRDPDDRRRPRPLHRQRPVHRLRAGHLLPGRGGQGRGAGPDGRRPRRHPDRRRGVPDQSAATRGRKDVSMLLEDKNAIITGAGSGVGRASALRFAEEGAKVVCADLDADAAKETVRLVEEAGGTAVPFAVDVSKEDEVVDGHRRGGRALRPARRRLQQRRASRRPDSGWASRSTRPRTSSGCSRSTSAACSTAASTP